MLYEKPSTSGKTVCEKKEFKKKERKVIDWKDADKHIGEYVITKGKIVSSFKNEKVCFLNFHEDYKNHLSLVIFANSYKKFPLNPEKFYLNREIQVEGRIKEYKGRLEIILNSQAQVKYGTCIK